MFSENTLLLYQKDLQLVPYFVKWQLAIDGGLPRFPINHFDLDCGPYSKKSPSAIKCSVPASLKNIFQNNYGDPYSRAVQITENLWYLQTNIV